MIITTDVVYLQSNILQSFDTTPNIMFIKREEKRVPLKNESHTQS